MNKTDSPSHRDAVIALRKNIPENQYKRWTQAEKQELIEMHRNGYDISEMAILLQRSEQSIMNQLRTLGLSPGLGSRKSKVQKQNSTVEIIDFVPCAVSKFIPQNNH